MCGYPGGVASPARSLTWRPEDTGRRLDLFLAEKLELSRAQVRRLLASGAVSLDGRTLAEAEKGARLAARRRAARRAVRAPRRATRARAARGGRSWCARRGPAGSPSTSPPACRCIRCARTRPARVLNARDRAPSRNARRRRGRAAQRRRAPARRRHLGRAACRDPAGELGAAARGLRRAPRREGLSRARARARRGAEQRRAAARHRAPSPRARARGGARRARARRAHRPARRIARSRSSPSTTLLEVRPRTGFLHQIRATLAHLGYPVAGDRSYGRPGDATGAERQMLHAARVVLRGGRGRESRRGRLRRAVRALARRTALNESAGQRLRSSVRPSATASIAQSTRASRATRSLKARIARGLRVVALGFDDAPHPEHVVDEDQAAGSQARRGSARSRADSSACPRR